MAHQPKAYKKFVATAATATLVASAIAPVASAAETKSFTDVSGNYKAAVDYLVAQGITDGKTATTFGTTDNITRGDAAVFIARALKLDVDNAKDQGFTDLNSRVKNAVNAVVEAKIAGGKSETKFDPGANITRQEMAKMLANAYKLTAKENANFTDVNSNWIGYVSALKEAGITLGKTETTFAPTANLTRGEFALFMYRAEGTPTVGEVALTSVNATGAKKITVKFNKPVEGAEFTFKRGNVELTGEVTWNEKKTEATFETSTRLATAEYSVDAKVGEKEFAETFKVEASKVADIQINSDVLVLVAPAQAGGAYTSGTVSYKVVNQYGEDVTNSSEANGLTLNSSRGTATPNRNTGVITISVTAPSEIKKDDVIVLSAVHGTTGVTTSKALKASDSASVADFKFTGVKMPKDVETIYTSGNNGNNEFYLEFEAFDQYGNAITNQAALTAGLSQIVSSRSDVATATWGTDAVTGKAYIKINPQSMHGSSTFTVVPLATVGKSAQITVEIAQPSTPKTISLDVPATDLKKGEFVYIPYTAEDQYGKSLTKFEDLNSALTVTVSPNNKFTIAKEKNPINGQLRIKLTAASDAPATANVLAQVGTSVSQIAVNTTDVAEVTRIAGLVDNAPVYFEKSSATQPSTDLTLGNIDLRDQYGRDTISLAGNQRIVAKVVGSTVTLSGTAQIGATGEYVLNGTLNEKVTLTGTNTAGNSTLNLRVQEQDANGDWNDTEIAFNKTIATVAKSSIVDFNVTNVEKLYGDNTAVGQTTKNAGYGVALNVYGLTSDGTKVALHTNTYKADELSDKLSITGDIITALGHTAAADITGSFVVTFEGANGPVAKTQTVTISSKAPVAEKIDVLSATEGVAVVSQANFNGDRLNLTTTDGGNVRFSITDQYGKKLLKPTAYYVTNITTNTGATAVVNGHMLDVTGTFVTGDSLIVTAVTSNGLTAQVKLVVGN